MAMDLLTTLVEHNMDVFEDSENDLAKLAKTLIPLCLVFLNNIDEEMLQTDWNKPQDIIEQEDYFFGGDCLARISEKLDSQLFWDLCYKNVLIKGFQQNSHWRDRLTALTTIERCIEYCSDLFITDTGLDGAENGTNGQESDDKSEELFDDSIDKEKLGPIVQASGQSLTHSNPFVRYEALVVIKQLSVAFGGFGFQTEYHSCIMNALNEMIAGKASQNEHRCVKIQICDTLAHFCYEFEPELMKKYADKTLGV